MGDNQFRIVNIRGGNRHADASSDASSDAYDDDADDNASSGGSDYHTDEAIDILTSVRGGSEVDAGKAMPDASNAATNAATGEAATPPNAATPSNVATTTGDAAAAAASDEEAEPRIVSLVPQEPQRAEPDPGSEPESEPPRSEQSDAEYVPPPSAYPLPPLRQLPPVEDPAMPGGDDEDFDRCSRSTMSTASLIANGCTYTILEQMFMTPAGDDAKVNVATVLSQLVQSTRSIDESVRELVAVSRGQEAALGAIAEALRGLGPILLQRASSRATRRSRESRPTRASMARMAEAAADAASVAAGPPPPLLV